MVFLVLRESQFTCQGLILADIKAGVSKQMLKYAASLPKESIVDVKATIVKVTVQISLENTNNSKIIKSTVFNVMKIEFIKMFY